MADEGSTQDVRERLQLIESMIAEGRRQTERWGWTFLLWGIAFYVAVGWSSWRGVVSLWGSATWAWPVTMVAAFVLTVIIARRRGRGESITTAAFATGAIWICAGTSMLLVFPALGFTGRLDPHSFVALVGAILAIANGASGMIYKWRAQIACAVIWWATAILACFGSAAQVTAVFLAAIFFCQILFGIYAMILESRRRSRVGVTHA